MILFVSDMHFSKSGDPAREREKERALVACLRAHWDEVERLYLLGDVFDTYVEYPSLVPKGFVRFQGLLAEWTDRGVPVAYLVGNHDPWHLDYFERELGVRTVDGALLEPLCGRSVYMHHGDGIHAEERLYRWMLPVARHAASTWLYRNALPGDAGMRLARWASRTFGDEEHEPEKAAALRRRARRVLRTEDADLALMGHTHLPERRDWPEGAYLNLGAWHGERTFALLDDNGDVRLLRWQRGGEAVPVDD